MSGKIYSLEMRPGGLFMPTEDFMALLAELTERGIRADVKVSGETIFFQIVDGAEQ